MNQITLLTPVFVLILWTFIIFLIMITSTMVDLEFFHVEALVELQATWQQKIY